jgi:rhodanese-related sulfurtransferase
MEEQRPTEQTPRIEPRELRAKMEAGEDVLVVDVRREETYAAGHIPGAINIPLLEMESRIEELPRDREIALYCT